MGNYSFTQQLFTLSTMWKALIYRKRYEHIMFFMLWAIKGMNTDNYKQIKT